MHQRFKKKKWHGRRCPVTNKRSYKDKLQALEVAAVACHTGAQRAYQCNFCPSWHLTSKPDKHTASAPSIC